MDYNKINLRNGQNKTMTTRPGNRLWDKQYQKNNLIIFSYAVSLKLKRKGKGTAKIADYILIFSEKSINERATAGVDVPLHKFFQHSINYIDYINENNNRHIYLLIKNMSTHSNQKTTITILWRPIKSTGQNTDEVLYLHQRWSESKSGERLYPRN